MFQVSLLGAQSITLPPNGDNQRTETTQYLGAIAHVSVKYSSPDVTGPRGEDRKGKIWGGVVPYGLSDLQFGRGPVSPWRAGANENTVVEVSHDMLVEGQGLAAGAYGLHIIPEEEGPWTIIFSRNSHAWGSYSYDQDEDALRVRVTPQETAYTEWLTYDFIERHPNYTLMALRWENLQLPIRFELPDPKGIYVDNLKRELQGGHGFYSINYAEAAQYCVRENTHLEQALEWAEMALNMPWVGREDFTNLQTKAQVLAALDQKEESRKWMNRAIEHPSASATDLHQYGRELLAQGEIEEGLRVFRYNFDRFKGAWPTQVGMMRGLSAKGDYKAALKHARLALPQAPNDLNKSTLQTAIERLEQGLAVE